MPFSNINLEPDLMMLCPPGGSLHFARVGGYDLDAIPDEHQMRSYSDAPFEEVVDSLRACRPDVMLYGCTSATLAQGLAFEACGFRCVGRADTAAPLKRIGVSPGECASRGRCLAGCGNPKVLDDPPVGVKV